MPNAPTNASATPGNAQATISFSPPNFDGGSPILYYTATSNPGSLSASGTGSPITVHGLLNDTSYTFTVSATNAIGTSASSSPSNSVTPSSSYGNIYVSQKATSTFAFLASTTATLTSNPAPGDILCATISIGNSLKSVSDVTGGGVIWSRMVSQQATSFIAGELWCGFNSDGSNKTVQVTIDSPSSLGFTVVDFTGIPSPGQWGIDVSTGATASSTALTTGVLTGTSVMPEIIIGIGATNAASQGISNGPTGGFTTLTNIFDPPPNGSPLSIISAWLNATGTASTSWTLATSTRWVGLIAALEQATTSTPPRNLNAIAGNAQVFLSWSDPLSNGGSAITQYLIYNRLTGSSTFNLVATTSLSRTTSTVTSLVNGQSYDFEVIAQNAIGTSTPSNVVSSAPGSITVSQIATSTFAFVTSTTATFPSDPAPGDILCVADAVGSTISPVADIVGGGVTWIQVTSQVAASLISGEIWCGFNSSGSGKVITDTLTARTTHGFAAIDFTNIPNPTEWGIDVSTGATASSTALTTGATTGTSPMPEIMVGMGATNNPSGQGVSVGPTGGFTTLTNFFEGGGAVSLVSAWLNATGTASTSWTMNVSGRWAGLLAVLEKTSISTPPQNLVAFSGDTQATLAWSVPLSTGGLPITQYIIYDKLDGLSTWTQYATTTATTSIVTGLENGESYDFEVIAQNALGTSTPSNISTATPYAFSWSWPQSNIYDGAFVNVQQYVATYITNHPTWFSHVDITSDLSMQLTNGSTTISTTTAESLYLQVKSALEGAQGSGGNLIPVGMYVSGRSVQTIADEPWWPYHRVPREWMPSSSVYTGNLLGDPTEFIIDVTNTSTVQSLQAGIKTLWSMHPSTLYMLDNAAENSSQGATTSWPFQCANIAGIREMANASGSATVFNIATAPGLMSASDTDMLVQAIGKGNALMLENPWDDTVQASSTLTQVAINTYQKLLDGGIAVFMLPVSVDAETLAQWVRTWRKPADNIYISEAFYHEPDPLVGGPFLSIDMTAPINGSTVGSVASVSAVASSSYSSISSVQFLLDGVSLGNAVSSAPYQLSWDSAQAPNGNHQITALMTDQDSNTITSSPVTVNVENIIPVTENVGVGGGGSAYTLSINGGAATTPTANVTLSLYATMAYTMEISNTPDFASSTWVPCVTVYPWTLTADPGTKTVYARFRSIQGGDLGTVSASIELVNGIGAGTGITNSTNIALQAQIIALQEQLQSLLARVDNSGVGVGNPSYAFARDLGLWDRGVDVQMLQTYLIAHDNGPAAARLQAHGTTQTFGLLTYNALREFQAGVDIVPASGYFGPITRGYLGTHP